MKGRVTVKNSDIFQIETENGVYNVASRGKHKNDGIFVGDEVLFDIEKLVIEKLIPRKNLLIRPNLANLSKLFIVIAFVPKPDFAIVDKLILFSYVYDIEPILVINKTDITDQNFFNKVENIYKNVLKIIYTSAEKNEGIQKLHDEIKNNICAFAGQSAVGKSALITKIYPQSQAIVGELSKKIQRGKNTTRTANLYKLEQNTFIADTPGFSSLDILYLPIKYFELCYYYPDFLKWHENCKYKSCTHSNEPQKECGVKQAVESGHIDKERYNRYVEMFEILKTDFVKGANRINKKSFK